MTDLPGLNFQLGEDIDALRDAVRDFAQAEIAPPTFVIFCNRSAFVTRAYENFLRNRMREDLGLPGVPVRIVWREKGPWKRKAERDADRASEAAALEAPAKGSRKERREAKLAEDAKSA